MMLCRQATLEFLDIPWPGHIKRKVTPSKLGPDVGDRAVVHGRRPPLAKHARIEIQCAAKSGAGKIAPLTVLAQQGIVLLEPEREQWFKFVQRQQDPAARRAPFFFYGIERKFPFSPRARWPLKAGFAKQVAAVKQHAGIDV